LEGEKAGKYYLPDVMMTCDDRDHSDLKTKRHPKLVIEVISESSEKRGRGDKFHAYLKLTSLDYYILVAQNQVKVEVFTKMDSGGWAYYMFDDLEATIKLAKIGTELSIKDIYEDVTLSGS
jgi:Uma2 family endonuclease